MAIVLGAVVTLALVFAGVLMLIEWKPGPVEDTPVSGGGDRALKPPVSLDLLSFNIGYGGLGRQADFFMDGGEQVRPERDAVEANLAAFGDVLRSHPADIVLLQEVDRDSSRSYGIDQAAALAGVLPGFARSMALNFKVPWIPYPVLRPLGRVESGLLSLSRYPLGSAKRLQLPGYYPWPVRVFHLKRCLHLLRFPAPDGKDWVIINLHLSAFDKGGRLRQEQMVYLKKLVMDLTGAGHHLIAGGDWNQAFPGIDGGTFAHGDPVPGWFQQMDPAWLPAGFRWAYDRMQPSLRAINKPYTPGENFLTIVDGFLVGPGIEVLEVHTTNLGFANSDHNPVLLRVRL
ncbi:MAG TPA: endonuclease/exonuclease/phosphatase family protein [Myxococcota bacterium]|nr:endonuclease/exonuclease/phosphatase family protein [Myxococcota bacterium]